MQDILGTGEVSPRDRRRLRTGEVSLRELRGQQNTRTRGAEREIELLVAIEAYWRTFRCAPKFAELERFLQCDCRPTVGKLRARGLLVRGSPPHHPGLCLTGAGVRALYPIPGWRVSHAA